MTEPTIEDFRDSWACEHVRPEMTVDERREAFDRMIAQVRAAAWDEGYSHCFDFEAEDGGVSLLDNPYRAREEQDQ